MSAALRATSVGRHKKGHAHESDQSARIAMGTEWAEPKPFQSWKSHGFQGDKVAEADRLILGRYCRETALRFSKLPKPNNSEMCPQSDIDDAVRVHVEPRATWKGRNRRYRDLAQIFRRAAGASILLFRIRIMFRP
jgi:hypothetical protein